MKSFKSITAALLVVLQAYSYASDNQEIDKFATAFMQQNHVEGLSIATVNKNGVIQTFNYGYANEKTKTPTSNKTIYRIASFSKTYTATLAAVASVEGKLNLDGAFNQYIPELASNVKLNKITSNMLLAHVSSFPFDFKPTPRNYSEVIRDLNKFTPAYAPDSQYGYSNAGIGTMGYVLQCAYAESYEALLANKVAKPLNLQSTYLHLPQDKESDVALGHEQNNKLRPYDQDIDIWFAAASLKSNIADMAKFLNAQINYNKLKDPILSQAILSVHQNKYCLIGNVACEQLGWQAHTLAGLNNSIGDTFAGVDQAGNLTFALQRIVNNPTFPKNKIFIDKSCGGYGMSGYMAYLPEQKVGVVILLNKSVGSQRIKLGRDILKRLNEK